MRAGLGTAGDVAPRRRSIRPGGWDPLHAAWSLLTNVKFALFLVGCALVAGSIGTLVPQVPPAMRGNAAAEAAWLESQREDFGALTDPMRSLGFFDVFHSLPFTILWATIIAAVTVCTVSRLRPTWRSVARPPLSVPDSFFDAHARRGSFAYEGDTGAVAAAVTAGLERRRYAVRVVGRAGAGTPASDGQYLFADRFAWSRYGTFLSHLALIALLVGAMLTLLAGFDRTLVIAESTPAAPIFDDPGPNQLFVKVVDAERGTDAEGNIIDFHTDVEVRRGDELKTCRVTVNGPCSAFGYRVHQASFFDDLAGLRVTDAAGTVVYDGVLDFEGRNVAVPHLRIWDPIGRVVLDEPVPQLASETGGSVSRDDDVALGSVELPDLSIGLAWRLREGEMALAVSTPDGLYPMTAGQSLRVEPFLVEFVRPVSIPATRVEDMPGAGPGGATVQMVPRADGSSYLVLSGVADDNVAVAAGQSARGGAGYTYSFAGRVEAAGLGVRRDPGDTFIWIAVGLGLVGLAITFYVPRRRLWLRVRDGRLAIAGTGERTAKMEREFAELAKEAGL